MGAGSTAEVAALDPPATQTHLSARSGRYRWSICALLFFAATINYIDRQVIGILKPTLESQLGWNEIDYSNIVFAFQLAYAMGLLLVGRVMDWLGTRKGFSLAVLVWSVAAMAHALARSVLGFSAARFALGLGESGNFPASIKTVAEWFPRKERALATGIFNAGTNVGALTTPLVVPWITYSYGWRWAFIATGAIGFLWLIAWLAIYGPPERHARVSKPELAHIRSDPPEPTAKIAWGSLFPHRQTWAFAVGRGTSRLGGGSTSRLVCEHFYSRFGHVSAPGCGVGCGDRRHGGRGRRDADRKSGRLRAPVDGLISAGIHHSWIGISGCSKRDSPARAEARTCSH